MTNERKRPQRKTPRVKTQSRTLCLRGLCCKRLKSRSLGKENLCIKSSYSKPNPFIIEEREGIRIHSLCLKYSISNVHISVPAEGPEAFVFFDKSLTG